MIKLTEDSSEEMTMLAKYWVADLKASGSDEEALRQVSSILEQWASTGWKCCHDDEHSQTIRQFVDWARQRGVVLPWLEKTRSPAN